MDIKVIPQYRILLFPCTDIGTVSENKATTLNFIIPKELDDYPERKIFIANSTGSYPLQLVDNSVDIPREVTLVSNAEIQLVATNSEGREWRSQPYNINFYRSVDDSGENTLNELKKQWTTEAQRPLTILVNRVTEKVTELLNERRNKI